jgi:hypothetical protein
MEKKVNKIIPNIPEKRPPDQRKRLSLSFQTQTQTKQNSTVNDSQNDPTSYLNIKKLSIQNTASINSNSHIDDETNSFLNESHYMLDNENEMDDDNNHAYCYLSQTTNSIVIEEPSLKIKPKLPEKRFKFNTSTLITERQLLMKEYSLGILSIYLRKNYDQKLDIFIYKESFRQVIYQRGQNHICADCQSQDELPRWISCLYFITLCDLCAGINIIFLICIFANILFINMI